MYFKVRLVCSNLYSWIFSKVTFKWQEYCKATVYKITPNLPHHLIQQRVFRSEWSVGCRKIFVLVTFIFSSRSLSFLCFASDVRETKLWLLHKHCNDRHRPFLVAWQLKVLVFKAIWTGWNLEPTCWPKSWSKILREVVGERCKWW